MIQTIPETRDPTPSSMTVAGDPSKALTQAIMELEAISEPVDIDGMYADARWFQAQQDARALEPYRGTHVAVYKEEIVGTGENWLKLQLELARRFKVHPQRFIIEYVAPRSMRFFTS